MLADNTESFAIGGLSPGTDLCDCYMLPNWGSYSWPAERPRLYLFEQGFPDLKVKICWCVPIQDLDAELFLHRRIRCLLTVWQPSLLFLHFFVELNRIEGLMKRIYVFIMHKWPRPQTRETDQVGGKDQQSQNKGPATRVISHYPLLIAYMLSHISFHISDDGDDDDDEVFYSVRSEIPYSWIEYTNTKTRNKLGWYKIRKIICNSDLLEEKLEHDVWRRCSPVICQMMERFIFRRPCPRTFSFLNFHPYLNDYYSCFHHQLYNQATQLIRNHGFHSFRYLQDHVRGKKTADIIYKDC